MITIKKLRQQSDITQEQFAEEIGVSQATVSAWENNISHPTSDKLPAIAKALHCTIDELYSDNNKTA